MNKKLLIKISIVLFMVISNVVFIRCVDQYNMGNMQIEVELLTEKEQELQVYYADRDGDEWNEEKSCKAYYKNTGKIDTVVFSVPQQARKFRLDLGNSESAIRIKNVSIRYKRKKFSVDMNSVISDLQNDISSISYNNAEIVINTMEGDPYVGLDFSSVNYDGMKHIQKTKNLAKNVIVCFFIDFVLVLILLKFDKIVDSLYLILINYKLIINLSRNDFKTKYAGSYFGIVWAFVQPIVTILVYWFVFQVAFKGGPVDGCPYVLWLISGLVPWFFFQEALQSGTNSLIEYSYLVKKVVFNVSIIPIVKVVSALFVHIFFLAVVVIIYLLSGYGISIYAIQMIYYSLCMFILVIALTYITSALVVFFRDLGQIIGILLQIGIWVTPIMWNYKTMTSPILQIILELNPMFYIVNGYRQSLVTKEWLWNNPNMTVYFWILTMCLLGCGGFLFRKLKVHFADVL